MRRSICAFTVLALLFGAGMALGQAQKGSISVIVEDEAGGRLPGVTVTAESDQTLTRRTVITNDQGLAILVALDPANNYVVTSILEGFNGARNENVVVRAGQDVPIRVNLSLATVTEEMIVTAESPIVDVTNSVAGQDITLELTESLPTGRSYQDYLQLVPGVMPAVDQGQGNNPASRSGLNYRDLLGEVGQSRDNYYYLEGINVTDGVQGYSRTNINTEIIQEQSVLTGGLPAEFVGAPGLVSNVITKSGGNRFTGSVNYYFQDDSLVDNNEHAEDSTFSAYDTALTVGGPIVQDKAWFFASYRKVSREDDVANLDTGALMRVVEHNEDQAFAKLTWAPTQKDLLTGVFLSDPRDISGERDATLLNTRDQAEELGAERYSLNYSRVFSAASLDFGYSQHEGNVDAISAIQASLNDVSFRGGDDFSSADEQLGGRGDNNYETRGTESTRGAFEYFFDTSWGDHSVKVGFDLAEYDDFRNSTYVNGERYVSISNRYISDNLTDREVIDNFSIRDFNALNPSDYDGFMESVEGLANRQAFYDLFDIDGDGVISPEELADNLIFNGTAGNPDGQINYGRRHTLFPGAGTTRSEGTTFYLQDTWQWDRWSVNLGVRTEEWSHFATTGQEVFTFDYDYAPRLSIAYDLTGQGKSRLAFYYGRYYDPIRNNATNFVGSLTTREFEEQVYVAALDQWVRYRTRGGASQLDATFAPTTKTPYTDEFTLGYKTDLGHKMSFEVNLIKRETRDIIEDYDYGLYADPSVYPGPVDDPDSFFLGPGFFGFDGTPSSNFNIGTLPPGNFRSWKGLELIFRKRYSDNWQLLSSYNYADAEGNTNSDSNFDFAGDVLWLDPRAPNIEGTQPGLIKHLFKVAGSYNWDNGFQVGGAYRWNSGAIVNITTQSYRRNNPVQVTTPYEYAGVSEYWVRDDAVGGLENPSYGVLDLRAAFLWNISDKLEADFFLDIFNVMDDQKAVQLYDREAIPEFGTGQRFVDPRRYYLGARLRF
ncbi:MAG: TonB-dependent receptor [bacterium]|nr:TonB-dependent receptor [bacterium]